LIDQFSRRWAKEYLPTLVFRRKWNKSIKYLIIGDLVLARVLPLCLQKCFRLSICTEDGLRRLEACPKHNFVPKWFLEGIFLHLK
jgi:hypothetical protein